MKCLSVGSNAYEYSYRKVFCLQQPGPNPYGIEGNACAGYLAFKQTAKYFVAKSCLIPLSAGLVICKQDTIGTRDRESKLDRVRHLIAKCKQTGVAVCGTIVGTIIGTAIYPFAFLAGKSYLSFIANISSVGTAVFKFIADTICVIFREISLMAIVSMGLVALIIGSFIGSIVGAIYGFCIATMRIFATKKYLADKAREEEERLKKNLQLTQLYQDNLTAEKNKWVQHLDDLRSNKNVTFANTGCTEDDRTAAILRLTGKSATVSIYTEDELLTQAINTKRINLSYREQEQHLKGQKLKDAIESQSLYVNKLSTQS